MAKKKIEDFGEEIFGARKHLAQLNRELRATDIGDWTDAEREQNVTKNTAFPKVDYKKEYADGKDREVLYFIKTLRDKLPTQPLYPLKSLYTPEQLPEAKRQAQEDYLTTVSYVYQKAMQLEKPEDFKKFFNEVSAAKLPKSDKILKDAKKVLDFDGRWGEYTYQRFQSKLEKNKFCFSDKEKLLSNYEIYKYDGKNVKRDEQLSKAYHKDYMNVSFGYGKRIFLANNETEANPDNWKQDTYFAIAKGKVDLIAMNITSREALEEKLVAIEQEKPQTETAKKAGKKALKPPQLQHIRPTTEDYRQGKPVVEDDFMKDSSTATFPFRGVQFGNWTNQNDRQENLNMSFDAFKDLAKALHIHDEDVTLGGQLAIAYGARGHSGAVAHYEPAENVINLTKMRGAGSLGHEWGHALDNYIAKQIGSHEMYASEGASIDHIYGVDNPMVNLLNTMKYDNSDTGRTQFYRDAKALDGAYSTTGNQKGSNKKGLYWSSEAEMFARAFASYVHDKLGESDYLVGHSEGNYPITKKDGTETTVSISPQGKEKERINDAFDKLFERLKELEILHDSDRELPKERTNTAQKNAQEEQIQSSPAPESPAISPASESQKTSTEAKQTLQQLVENAMQKAKMIVDAENLKEGDIVRLYGDTAIDSRTMKPTELPPTYAKVDSVSESSISFKTYSDEECTKMNGISSCFSTPDEPWTKKLAAQGFDVIQTKEQQLAEQMAQKQETAQEQAEPAPEATEPKENVQNTEQADAQSATNDHSYEYMLLDRLRSDCEYFLGTGETAENNHLWAGNPEAQIEKMQELYDMLPEKPEWLTQEDINQYAQQMIPEKEAEKTEPPSPAVSEQESETNRIADEARLSALEAQKTALDSMMKTLEVSRDVLNPQAITAIEQAIASITADIERLSEPDAEKTAHTEQETQKNAEQPAPEHSESVAIDCDIADITRADDGFYEFELSIETVVEALNRAADVSEDLQNFFVENGVPEKSVIEADEPYMVYGEMNPDIDDGISMRLQLINPDIDVEIPLYKEECHALSEKIAILDKAEPELPKEDNEKEFVQLEFDFDKE
jgi:hypothetical protein